MSELKKEVNVTLGVGGFLGHDANAAVLVDAQHIASVQEERLSRLKHDGTFPTLAAAKCLHATSAGQEAVTDFVFAERPLPAGFFAQKRTLRNSITQLLGQLAREA